MSFSKDAKWWCGLLIGLGLGLFIWFYPEIPGLTAEGQKGLALMTATILFWIFRVADEAITGLLFIVAVIASGIMPSTEFLTDWTGPNLWFAISAFVLGAAVAKSGLVRRLTYHLLLRVPNTFAAMTAVLFVIQALFTVLGVAGSFARIALVYPLILEIAQASNLSREGKAFKGLAIAVMASGEPAMLLMYTGFWLNPFAMKLSGQEFFFTDWLRMFTVPALGLMVLTWLVVWLVFRNNEALSIPREQLQAKLAELGSFRSSLLEVKTTVFLMGILLLWLTDSWHQINPGWVALFGACLLMFPRIGVLDLQSGLSSVKWPIILFLGAAFGLGKMVGSLGLNAWLGELLLPSTAPTNAGLFSLLVSYVSIGLHFFAGDVASSMSVTIPPIAEYAASNGHNPAVYGFISYVCTWEQYLFPFQNAGVLMAYGYRYFTAKDLFKFGVVLAVVIPLGLILIGLPYWSLLGVLH